MNTHKFKLVSGPLCEVREFTGKHQRILTEQNRTKDKSTANANRMDLLLASIIVAIGSDRLEHWSEDKRLEYVQKLLGFDKKKILIEARQFTMDFDPDFEFKYKWVDEAGYKREAPIKVTLPYDEDNFPQKPMMIDGDNGELVPADFAEYDEVLRYAEVTITLPKSKEKVRFNMLDGLGETQLRLKKESERNINTILEIRRPVIFKSDVPVSLDLDKMAFKDIEYLRKQIKDREGDVDSTIMFTHPDAENRFGQDKNVEQDILGITAFFFPSEAL